MYGVSSRDRQTGCCGDWGVICYTSTKRKKKNDGCERKSTFYPRIPDANPDPNFWCRESHFANGFAKYGKEDDSWTHRIELYLLDCGVTKEEIATFREIMLEP